MVDSQKHELPVFDRRFFESKKAFSVVGSGAIGGKAQGLLEASRILADRLDPVRFRDFRIGIPTMTVVRTDLFSAFMERNKLWDLAFTEESDRRIAHAFHRAELPAELVGDLWGLIQRVRSPLAVRSSSLLEDALQHPFAGVYATKMIPNNQFDTATRFRKLVEAVKFVYASTFLSGAKRYLHAARQETGAERMAVIVQEVVGQRHGPRFYPDVSGVGRSYNFYPTGQVQRVDGTVSLALGLGKTIVDGGRSWTYSPARPAASPSFGSTRDLLELTQTDFWAVNMGPPPPYDPMAETEYLLKATVNDAESDGTLGPIASTYDPSSDRVVVGTRVAGPRVLNFAPLLAFDDLPLNALVRALLVACSEATGAHVEIEFALTLPAEPASRSRFALLQMRPMAISSEPVEITASELNDPSALVSASKVMGNGIIEGLRDIVFVRPDVFEPKHTRAVAAELRRINADLTARQRPYVLIGFGRWGSSDPWLGIPVTWAEISGARVIVESTLPNMDVEMSQGTHFFHNLISFQVPYFSVPHRSSRGISWSGLGKLECRRETGFVRHVEVREPLRVKVDGRTGRGVILRSGRKTATGNARP